MPNTITLSFLEELFATHPAVDTFYITTDGQAFEEQHNADGHAKRLKDKKVYPIERSDVEDSFTKEFEEGLEELNEIPGLDNLKAAYLEFLKDNGAVPYAIVRADREEIADMLASIGKGGVAVLPADAKIEILDGGEDQAERTETSDEQTEVIPATKAKMVKNTTTNEGGAE